MKNKALLKVWIHKIGRKNLLLNSNTRVCSDLFVSAAGRRLRPDEYPQRNLPVINTQITIPKLRKPPKVRIIPIPSANSSNLGSSKESVEQVDVETQLNNDSKIVIKELKKWITRLEDIVTSKFCI